ncbi:hypothetical protein GCM10023215_14650 [Pseudonocardia yuanmonensis]|uniref:Secreted protein n=1 Tax=Pseudonocardia yuanmonensis TaxID=1095914 RepID=A0ABP8W5W0_9PSEU
MPPLANGVNLALVLRTHAVSTASSAGSDHMPTGCTSQLASRCGKAVAASGTSFTAWPICVTMIALSGDRLARVATTIACASCGGRLWT